MIQNATAGKRFFGKHFWPGVAEYHEGDHVTRVLLNEDTIRKMNPSFEGKPVFVEHVDEVITKPIDELKNEADGWVVRSFYEPLDGDTWVEFLVTSQRGLDAIKKGWKLSNAYIKEATDHKPGLWNGITYDEAITDASFEHLAIVPNPRYAASVIKTPTEFREYLDAKKAELNRLQNSLDKKQEPLMSFNFFKKAKVENGLDLDGLTVQLPNTKREVALVDLIKEADVELKEMKNAPIVLVNEEKEEYLTIEEAVKEIKNLRNKCNELEEKLKEKEEFKEEKKENADGECGKKENEEDKKEDDKKEDNKCNEEDKKDEEKKDNEEEEKKEDDKKENASEEVKKVEEAKEKTEEKIEKNFLNELLNANQICNQQAGGENILLPSDRAALGRKYY